MGRQMSTATKFLIRQKEICGEPYHYTLCGLDDIFLLNGFKIHETPHGRGVAIENADELHKAIGEHLVKNRKALSPKDMRFLRKNMRFTQVELGRCLGVTSQTIARYEKGTTEITGPADRLMRFVYAWHLMDDQEREEVFRELSKLASEADEFDETQDEPVYFRANAEHWNEARPS
jgi:DNA-binding transcriptional regulator YiaG